MKRKHENTFIFRKETTQKIDSNMDEGKYHLQSQFYYPDDLETSEASISESQGKHKRKKSTDMNTLLRFIEANRLNSQTIKSLPASEIDHLLSISFFFFFMNVLRKNGEYEPATFSSFQRNIQRYFSEKKYLFKILKDNEFKKSRRVVAAKHSH